ncbi:MAG: peptide chain release factor 2 [Fibrobacterales bacterium]
MDTMREQVKVMEQDSTAPDFWDNNEKAQTHLKKIKTLKDWIEPWDKVNGDRDDFSEMYDLAKEEGDSETMDSIQQDIESMQKTLSELELRRMLSGEDDDKAAVMTINPGSGGTESQDWAEMLVRMYRRFFEKEGMNCKVLEYQEGEEAGIKSVTMEIDSEYAYGYLRSEVGVHRLVRISPFDSNARRHTSFAGVFLYPILEDIDFDIQDSDVRVDTYRASGAGGQHINKTDSAVRMTHIPTGKVSTCQSERSQIQNREKAKKILETIVYQHYRDEEEAKRDSKLAEKKKIEWGSQIRNYVLHPYTMVKDARTATESSDASGVLDGNIKNFIESYLLATGEE